MIRLSTPSLRYVWPLPRHAHQTSRGRVRARIGQQGNEAPCSSPRSSVKVKVAGGAGGTARVVVFVESERGEAWAGLALTYICGFAGNVEVSRGIVWSAGPPLTEHLCWLLRAP
ncbi:hypothetical protein E2C01_004632 [Portunus trituberculatus]|uniref:Uncharacterized protein n=1 Tax=Portunus trituberculatus TaxID=210409 RepID=A0A5B7CRV8_PORTR|nr:hypothetical protein [Portunus trituberculatus]